MTLEAKTVVVTGAASGIGAETAKRLHSAGAKIIAVDRNAPQTEVHDFHRVDLMDRDAIDRLVLALPSGIDGLANIAGLPPTLPPREVLTVNFVALKYLTEKLVQKFNPNASIVNLASLAGLGWEEVVPDLLAAERLDFADVDAFIAERGITQDNSYFFSKQALIAWTVRNRWTWRDRGIRMNAVSPGPVDTPILPDFIETLGERAEEDMRIMDRPGTPGDIAPVVAFLLSDGSAWIRGANLPVDGGMHSHILARKYGLEEGIQ